MNRQFPKEKKERFRGPLRHYHRAGAKSQRSWDSWIDEKSANAKSINWLKVLGLSIAVLALGGIIAGLIIELF